MSFTFYPITTAPAPYDIVWCRFPEHTDLGNPGPKARPALVLNVGVDPEADEAEVQLIYGTSKLKLNQRRHDFFVTNLAEMDACGLNKATRFDLDTISWIPWAQEWFCNLDSYASPVIGRLTAHGIKLLQIQLAHRIKAQGV